MTDTTVQLQSPSEYYGGKVNLSGGRSFTVGADGKVWVPAIVILELLALGFWPLQQAGSPSGGAVQYVHTQAVTSTHWIINHNFGYKPASVRTLNAGSIEVYGTVTDVSNYQVTVDFNVALSGIAIVE
jgi:hypothetical protein